MRSKLIIVTPLPADTERGLLAHYAMVAKRLRRVGVEPCARAPAVDVPAEIHAVIPAMMETLADVVQPVFQNDLVPTGYLATFFLVPEELAAAAEGASDLQKVSLVLDAMRKLPRGLNRINQMMRVVSTVFSISIENLKSARRTADIVRPRQIGMAIAYRLKLGSLPMIGRAFGGRDHTTVLHAVRKRSSLVEEAELGFLDLEMRPV